MLRLASNANVIGRLIIGIAPSMPASVIKKLHKSVSPQRMIGLFESTAIADL